MPGKLRNHEEYQGLNSVQLHAENVPYPPVLLITLPQVYGSYTRYRLCICKISEEKEATILGSNPRHLMQNACDQEKEKKKKKMQALEL